MIAKTQPKVGSLVLDTAMGRLAEFCGVVGCSWLLRPEFGGAPWDADPGRVRLTGVPVDTTSAPLPLDDCRECDDWWLAEQLALDVGALSEATDCRVLLRRHRYAAHGATVAPVSGCAY